MCWMIKSVTSVKVSAVVVAMHLISVGTSTASVTTVSIAGQLFTLLRALRTIAVSSRRMVIDLALSTSFQLSLVWLCRDWSHTPLHRQILLR